MDNNMKEFETRLKDVIENATALVDKSEKMLDDVDQKDIDVPALTSYMTVISLRSLLQYDPEYGLNPLTLATLSAQNVALVRLMVARKTIKALEAANAELKAKYEPATQNT